jgi:hypothetical protein
LTIAVPIPYNDHFDSQEKSQRGISLAAVAARSWSFHRLVTWR